MRPFRVILIAVCNRRPYSGGLPLYFGYSLGVLAATVELRYEYAGAAPFNILTTSGFDNVYSI